MKVKGWLFFSLVGIIVFAGASTFIPGASAASSWTVGPGDSFPITLTTSVKTAGNGSKSLQQTGNVTVKMVTGTSADCAGCGPCPGSCIVFDRSPLSPLWDVTWFAAHGNYDYADETTLETGCYCPSEGIPAKFLSTAQWEGRRALMDAYNGEMERRAVAFGSTNYGGQVNEGSTSIELFYAYSNATTECSGKIVYSTGILTKLVVNEESTGDQTGLGANVVVARTEKWAVGVQASIPGYPVALVLIVGTFSTIALFWKLKSRSPLKETN